MSADAEPFVPSSSVPSEAGRVSADVMAPPSAASATRSAAPPPASAATGRDAARGSAPALPPLPPLCYLSLVVPAYNEENRLPATLERIVEYLAARAFSHEIIVVDDGSRDATREVVREFAARHAAVRLEGYEDEAGRPMNRGKGAAVRQGVLAARGRDILFCDADLSTPIEEMERLLPPISRGDCDIAIASRALPESRLAVHQPWYREWIGRTGNKLVRRVLETSIADTQCGFKAFRGDVAKRLFGLAQIEGFGFDFEILFLAQKFGYRVRELPVTWEDDGDSRLNPLTAPLQALGELFQVRLNDARGLYDEAPAVADAAPADDLPAGDARG